MKKFSLILSFFVFTFSFGHVAFGGTTTQLKNLDLWEAAYWKDCGKTDFDGDDPCIGESRVKCYPKGVANPENPGDEWGFIMMVAVDTTDGGAYFCPTTIMGRNKKKKASVWTEYYASDGDCVWLCRPGKTGKYCEQSINDAITSCDASPLRRENYDTVKASGIKNIEDKIAMWGANRYTTCGGNIDREHDLVFIISDWLKSGHGAWVRPYVVSLAADNWNSVDSWIDMYPAAGANGDGTSLVRPILACKNGYKQNSAGDDCVPINQDLCGYDWCAGWGNENYDSTIHYEITTADGCKQYRCKQSGYALAKPNARECEPCINSALDGVSPKNGTCIHCEESTMFNKTATGSGFCSRARALDKTRMLYGNGSASTPLNDQCWVKDATDDYRKCVLQGLSRNSNMDSDRAKAESIAASVSEFVDAYTNTYNTVSQTISDTIKNSIKRGH